jgi:hypothetical protein
MLKRAIPTGGTLIRQFGCALLIWLAAAVAPAAAKDLVLFDFERGGLSDDWSAVRNIQVSRQPLAAPPPPAGEGAPQGAALDISTKGSGGLYAKSGRIPADWLKYRDLTFWMYRSPDEAARHPTSHLEVQLLEANAHAHFWRKVDVDHTGWKRYTVPLRWMRWGNGCVPRWDHLDRIGFWFRDAAEVEIDAVALVEGTEPRSAELSADELRNVAFPGAKADEIKAAQTKNIWLLSDARTLNEPQLVKHLEAVADSIFRELPFLPRPETATPLLVFATRDEYRQFVPRFAAQLNSAGAPPTSGGFSLQGVSTSYWDETQGTLRPVYTHEFAHGLLARSLRIPNSGEWLHEGLASHFQMRFHPQKDLPQIVSQGLKDEPRLSDLCSGKKIALNQYWQAMTVVELLLSHETYRQHWPELIAAFQKSGSTNLEPHLESVLHTTWPQFTQDWQAYCRKQFPAD